MSIDDIYNNEVRRYQAGETYFDTCTSCSKEFYYGDHAFDIDGEYYCEDCVMDKVIDMYEHTFDEHDVPTPPQWED